MDRALVSAIAHRSHPIAAPVSDENAYRLITALEPAIVSDRPRILDLGCGSGEWLLTALTALPGWEGFGIDLSDPALDEARRKAAAEHHLRDRVRFEHADAATWSGGRFDVVICIGATHAFAGLGPPWTRSDSASCPISRARSTRCSGTGTSPATATSARPPNGIATSGPGRAP